MSKNISETIIEELNENGKCVLRGLGTFEVVPARKGIVNVAGKPTNKKWRVRFKQSDVLRIER